jgi:MFS family permease
MAISGSRNGGVYYGWVIVAICMVGLFLSVGATMNAFGLYVLPVSKAFDLSRADMNSGLILMNAGAALAALIVGRLIDRYPSRLVMGGSALILGASLIGIGLSRSVWLSATLVFFCFGLGITGMGTLTAPALVARWFAAHRGRAIAITMMGMSIATISAAPAVAWLIDLIGWRASLVTLGCIVIAPIWLLLPFLRNAPGPADLEPGAGAEAAGADLEEEAETGAPQRNARQLLGLPRFWAIAVSTALGIAAFQGIAVSLVPIGREMGFSNTEAASLISVIGVTAITGKALVAWLGDRFDRALVLAGLYAAIALSSAMMLFAGGYPLLAAACALLGLAAGATMPLYLALLADQFGARSMGTANGMITFFMAVIGAGAVRFAGEVYDRTSDYALMFDSFILVGLAAAILMLAVRGPGRAPALAAAE